MTNTYLPEQDAYLVDIKAAARRTVAVAAAEPAAFGLPARSAWADLPYTDVYDGLRDAAYDLIVREYDEVLDLDQDLIDVTEWAVTAVFSPRSFR